MRTSQESKKKFIATNWMDLLTYIIIPFVTIVATVRTVRALLYSVFTLSFFVTLILEILFIGLCVFTFINSHRRTKLGYTLFRVLIYVSAFKAALDFSLTDVSGYNQILAFVGYLALSIIVWIYPNEVYLKKRKNLFENESCSKNEKNKKDIK